VILVRLHPTGDGYLYQVAITLPTGETIESPLLSTPSEVREWIKWAVEITAQPQAA
jgi:hypothetical protein